MPVRDFMAVALTAALKFFGGPVVGLALGLVWWQTALATFCGAMCSIALVAVLGQSLVRWSQKFRKKPSPRFNKRSRMAVWVWQRFQMSGIAFLTPLVFTPIGGTLLALSFRVPFWRLLGHMAWACAFWAVVFGYSVGWIQSFFSL
jgi:hypothetical protein